MAESGEPTPTLEAQESPAKPEVLSLETILERLGRVVDSLEKGDLPLEESLRIFEEGVRLTREGQRRLDAAERRIETLLTTDPGVGEPAMQPLTDAR